MQKITRLTTAVLTAAATVTLGTMQSAFALTWNWSYYNSSKSVNANGTFMTDDTPNNQGLYQITGITGQRNGETITGLWATDTGIPGFEDIAVDNLIGVNSQQAILTEGGFGYSTIANNYNPYFSGGFYEAASVPTEDDGFDELNFTATPIFDPDLKLGGDDSSSSGGNSGAGGSSNSGGDSSSSGSSGSGGSNTGSDNSGTTNSGTNNSGTTNSGTNNSGTNNSGTNNSGTNNSGGNSNSGEGAMEESIPTPAMLPGLIGMGVTAMRKRRKVPVPVQ
jgi:uncharacterized membrane protein YgcG